jgi:hypothetical protein
MKIEDMLDVWFDFAFLVNWFELGQRMRTFRKRTKNKEIYPCWFYAESGTVMSFER